MMQHSLRKNLLLLVAGLLLISFGGARLQAGTSGMLETFVLSACIASGLCFLAAVLIVLSKAVLSRIRTGGERRRTPSHR